MYSVVPSSSSRIGSVWADGLGRRDAHGRLRLLGERDEAVPGPAGPGRAAGRGRGRRSALGLAGDRLPGAPGLGRVSSRRDSRRPPPATSTSDDGQAPGGSPTGARTCAGGRRRVAARPRLGGRVTRWVVVMAYLTARLVPVRAARGREEAVEDRHQVTGSGTGSTSIPPTTTIASGFCACEPIEVARAAGSRPRIGRQRGHDHRAEPQLGPAHHRLADRQPRGPHLVEVRDQEHAVLHGDAEDRDEPDRRRDAERRAASAAAPRRPPSSPATTLAMTSRASFSELNAV